MKLEESLLHGVQTQLHQNDPDSDFQLSLTPVVQSSFFHLQLQELPKVLPERSL